MAQGRMIQRKISRNKDLPALISLIDKRMGAPHGAYAALLYTWCIAHLDVDGRMHGDPLVVKGEVFPRLQVTAEHCGAYLEAMAEIGLVQYYQVEGDYWLSFCAFERSQPGLRRDRESPSMVPPPEDSRRTPGELPEDAGVPDPPLPENARHKFKSKSNINITLSAGARVMGLDHDRPHSPGQGPAGLERIGQVTRAWADAGLPPNGNSHEMGILAAEIDAAHEVAKTTGGGAFPSDLELCRAMKQITDDWARNGRTSKMQPSKLASSIGLAIQVARGEVTVGLPQGNRPQRADPPRPKLKMAEDVIKAFSGSDGSDDE